MNAPKYIFSLLIFSLTACGDPDGTAGDPALCWNRTHITGDVASAEELMFGPTQCGQACASQYSSSSPMQYYFECLYAFDGRGYETYEGSDEERACRSKAAGMDSSYEAFSYMLESSKECQHDCCEQCKAPCRDSFPEVAAAIECFEDCRYVQDNEYSACDRQCMGNISDADEHAFEACEDACDGG